MSELPSAKQSPRVVNGVLRAYENDTFDLNIELDLTDQDGTPITVQSTDNIKIVFRDKTNTVIKEFSFTGATNSPVQEGRISLRPVLHRLRTDNHRQGQRVHGGLRWAYEYHD